MAINPLGSNDIPLSLFAGLNTETSPVDLPEGASPDCKNVSFKPGNVFTRPCLNRLYNTPVPNNVGINYVKSFVQADDALTLFLGSDGKLWSEDTLQNPGNFVGIGTVASGLLATSFTSFDREYLSFHDGWFGREIPRQYDGINLDRVSQDGPAVNSVIATDFSNSESIVNVFQSAPISSITEDANGICTVTFPVAHGLVANQTITVSGVVATANAYNGVFTILSTPTPTTLTYVNTVFGLPAATVTVNTFVALGTFLPIIPGTAGASQIGNVCTIVTTNLTGSTTPAPHGLAVGNVISIVGVTVNGYNGTFTVSATPTNTTFSYVNTNTSLAVSGGGTVATVDTNVTVATPHGLTVGDTFVISGTDNPTPRVAVGTTNPNQQAPIVNVVSTAAGDGTITFTWTTSVAHGLSVGDIFMSQGVSNLFYNAVYSATVVPNSTTVQCTGIQGVVIATGTGGSISTFATVVSAGAAFGVSVGDVVRIAGNTAAPTGSATSQLSNEHLCDAGSLFPGTPACPPNWVVRTIVNPTTFTFGFINQFGSVAGGQPSVFGGFHGTLFNSSTASFANGTWTVSKVIDSTHLQFINTSGANSGNTFASNQGTLTGSGRITAGIHNFVVMFLTRNGFITAPSPVGTWNCGGNKQVQLANIPTGPANVTARIIAFTPTGGGNYFYIPINVTGGNSTIIADNITTSTTFNFSDNTLMSSIGIDVDGNNLFNQVALAPNAGGFAYGNRTLWWGERNKIQNLLNMGFDGGSNGGVMLGWTIKTAGGLLVNTGDFGGGWQVTGDGSANLIGQIQQTAFQDQFSINILQPNTAYTFVCFASVPVLLSAGTIVATLSSASTSFTASAVINCNTLTINGGFVQADFSNLTPISIPSDLVFSVATQNTVANAVVILDEFELVPSLQPFADTQIRCSYVINPEAFDGTTGLILVAAANGQPVRQLFTLRDNLYIAKSGSLYVTSDNGQEPFTWSIQTVSSTVGALSSRSVDVGDNWAVIASRGGLYLFSGGDPVKISQEIQSVWDRINWAAANTVWVKVDILTRRIYVGVPLDDALSPNNLLVMHFTEENTPAEIQSGSPIHIGYSGKMMASDLTRKWAPWDISANSANLIFRPDNSTQFVLGSGTGLGLNGGGTGNVYFLDSTIFSDKDFGLVDSYYTTYFFINHEMEQALQIGSHRKLVTYLSLFASGVGNIRVTPLVDQLNNLWRPTKTRALSQNPTKDMEWGMNAKGERIAFKIEALPTPTQNIIPDSNGSLGTFAISGTKLSFNPTAGATQGGGWQFIGDGNAASFAFAMSDIIPVVPGTQMTISGYIDASQVNLATDPGSLPFWAVEDSRLTTTYALVSQQAGVNGQISQTFTIPAGVTQVVVIGDTNNCVVNNGGVLTFSNPQLEVGAQATAYTPQNLDASFTLDKMVVTMRQDPWSPVSGRGGGV